MEFLRWVWGVVLVVSVVTGASMVLGGLFDGHLGLVVFGLILAGVAWGAIEKRT